MIENETQVYFQKNAEKWMSESYDDSGYLYSTPRQRLRVVMRALSNHPQIHTIADIGCGGCMVSIELARMGYEVTALEQSDEMLAIAKDNIKKEPAEVQNRINLVKGSADKIFDKKHDCIIALGLIGYLESDDKLFSACQQNLVTGGLAVISFRNRLFNLYSTSHRTINEVDNGTYENLFDEIKQYYSPLQHHSVVEFLENLQAACGRMLAFIHEQKEYLNNEIVLDAPLEFEPRQSTPQSARNTAKSNNFSLVKFVGVHPHFLLPGANKCLPPEVYNQLSNSLCCFEEENLALTWSSVFIGIFEKNS